MKIVRNKTKTATVTFVMLLTIAALMASMPSVNATVVEINTFLDVMASPNPVGVTQEVLVTFQLDKVSPTVVGVYGGDHFTGFTVKITDPDGNIYTTPAMEAWATSGSYFTYTPAKEGTHKIQAFFPGQWINYTSFGVYYEMWYRPSQSGIFELTVQQEPIPEWPTVPLPTDYWTRPIYGENKGWWQVSGNWLMKGYDIMTRPFPGSPAFAPYTTAPNSAHIMWIRQQWFGGVVGGIYGDKDYYSGLSYEQPYEPIIIGGRIIYPEHGPTSSFDIFGTRCIDLYTGEEIWYLEDVNIAFAQCFAWESPNEHGILPYLWSVSGGAFGAPATLKMYDAFTGIEILTIENVTWGMGQSMYWGQAIFGPSGEILSYSLDTARSRLIMWNSTRAVLYPNIGSATWSPGVGSVIDGRNGIQWNVSIPATPGAFPGVWMINDERDILLAGFADLTRKDRPVYTHVAYDLSYDGSKVKEKWRLNRTNIECMYLRLSRNIQDGYYTQYDEAKKIFHGYEIETGKEVWATEALPPGWSIFTRNYIIAYGKLFTVGYDGIVRAWNITTGKLQWSHYYGSAGWETHYGSWPTYAGPVIADNKIYTTNDDHSPDSVLWRGGKLWVFNTDDGSSTWNISGWFRIPAIADGYLTAANSLDGQIYCFGKGPTAATAAVSQQIIEDGSKVLITGTVTDQSPAQPDTPCVSKESMSAWMEYLHMQKTMPASVTGVPVLVEAYASNGSIIEIGWVTSDLTGFKCEWTPPFESLYTIMATFPGDESYGSAWGAISVLVTAAPPQPEEPAYLTIDLALMVAVVIAIVIGLANLWALRKRK